MANISFLNKSSWDLFCICFNEKDELFQYHYKNHLLRVLHFVIPGPGPGQLTLDNGRERGP